jgi:hypothetical protein
VHRSCKVFENVVEAEGRRAFRMLDCKFFAGCAEVAGGLKKRLVANKGPDHEVLRTANGARASAKAAAASLT